MGIQEPMGLQRSSGERGSVSLVSDFEIYDDDVDVIVPLNPRFASMLRTMTAAFGVDTGFSVDEIDDFKLALTEAFSMLVVRHGGKRTRATFAVAADAMSVRMSLESGDDIDVEPDELALAILRAVVDSYEIANAAITLKKRATETSMR